MKLNHNFDKRLEKIINSYQPLADWFERNQETMAYFELTHKGCLHLTFPRASHDLITLSKMADAFFSSITFDSTKYHEEIARTAAQTIEKIFREEEENLTPDAKEKYAITTNDIQSPTRKR